MPNTRKNRKNTRKNNMRKSRKNNTMSGGSKKRGMNPYMKFANKHRAEVMRAHPGAAVPDIGREIGKKWRALSDAEKKSYA
jgi:hypothetical protein